MKATATGAEFSEERPGFGDGREVVQESFNAAYESNIYPQLEEEEKEGAAIDPQSE